MGEVAGLLRILATESREGRLQPSQVAVLKSQLLSDNPTLIARARATLMPQARFSVSESIPPPPPRSSMSEIAPPDPTEDRWSRRSFEQDDTFPAPPPDFYPDDSDDDDEVIAPPSAAELARAQSHEDEESKFEAYERSEVRDQRRRLYDTDPSTSQSPASRVATLKKDSTSPLQVAKQIVGVVPPKSRRCDFVLIQNQAKNKFRMRWAEVDPDNMTFSYWKNRAARGNCSPIASYRIPDIASLEWNTKDVTRGRRASLLGTGGIRFTINMKNGIRTMCKAQNPLDARAWLNCLQELLTPLLQDGKKGIQTSPDGGHVPTPEEVCLYKAVGTAEKQSGILQKAEGNSYKDRWCTLDTVTKVLSYWAKQPKNESVEKPEGTVNIADVFTFEWNSRDLAQGRRRSFIKMDGVRFVINFKVLSKEPEQWRANNPYEAYRWKDILEKLHSEVNAAGTPGRVRSGSMSVARSPTPASTSPLPLAASAAFVPPPPPPLAELEAIQASATIRRSTTATSPTPRSPSTEAPRRSSQTLPHPTRDPPVPLAAISHTLPRPLPDLDARRVSAPPMRLPPLSPAPRRDSAPHVSTARVQSPPSRPAPSQPAPRVEAPGVHQQNHPSPPPLTDHRHIEVPPSGPSSPDAKLPPRQPSGVPPPPPLSSYPTLARPAPRPSVRSLH